MGRSFKLVVPPILPVGCLKDKLKQATCGADNEANRNTLLSDQSYVEIAVGASALRWFSEVIACNGFQPVTVALC